MNKAKRTLLATLAIMAAITQARAFDFKLPDDMKFSIKLGYNIGGTSPIGIPATIRKMNNYKMQANFSLSYDMQFPLKGAWGLTTGLRLENKGMEVDATVKNYRMAIVQGGSRLEGYYTGNTVIKAEQWLFTLPAMATYNFSDRFLLRFGPYVSYVITRKFNGYVYDGYLRQTDPTGAKVNMGDTKETGATFDFTDDMRRWHFGLDAGFDWYIYRRFGIYADLAWGVTGVFKKDFNTIEQTLYPIYGTIGITYKL